MDSSLIEIPNFEGFSYSWIDQEIDYAASNDLEYYEEEYELNEEERDNVESSFFSQNMEELKEKISKAYVSAYFQPIEEETNIILSPIFESLGSQYHPCHALDILYCELPTNEVIELLRWIFKNKYEELKEVIKQRFTARDGYYPHYENDLKKWGKISLWDHNQIGTALLVFFEYDDFNYSLHEDVSTVISENIFNTLSDDTQEFLNKRWQKIDAKKAQLSLSF